MSGPANSLWAPSASVSRGYEWYPEYTLDIEAELDDVPKRTIDRFVVSEETKRELKEAFAYWRDHETVQKERCGARLRAVLPAEVFDKGILLDKRGGEGEGHLVPNFEPADARQLDRRDRRGREQKRGPGPHAGRPSRKT